MVVMVVTGTPRTYYHPRRGVRGMCRRISFERIGWMVQKRYLDSLNSKLNSPGKSDWQEMMDKVRLLRKKVRSLEPYKFRCTKCTCCVQARVTWCAHAHVF